MPIVTKHDAGPPDWAPLRSQTSLCERLARGKSDRSDLCLAEERLQIVRMTAEPDECRAANDADVHKQHPPGGNKEAYDAENEPDARNDDSVESACALRKVGKRVAVFGNVGPAETARDQEQPDEQNSPPHGRTLGLATPICRDVGEPLQLGERAP